MKKQWENKKLADVSSINYGYTESASIEPIGPHFLRITDIQNDCVDWNSVPFCKIEAIDALKFKLKTGDVVFARTGATTGKSFLVKNPPEAVFASYLIRLRLLESKIIPEFVWYFFQTNEYWQFIKDGFSGSAQGGFNASKLGTLIIPIPPITEQKHIVSILDKAFADIATAKANAEKNLQNARALFESYLNTVFSARDKEWHQTFLEKVLVNQPQNGWSPPAANHSNSGTPVLTLSSVTGFHFRPDKIKYTSAPTDSARKYWVKNGDLLITRSNTPELVGHVAIASDINEPTIYPDLIMRMNPIQDLITTEFLYFQLRTRKLRNLITGRANGANPTMKKISNSAVKSLPIVVPRISVQQSIVAKLEIITTATQRLTTLYQSKLTALEELKKSILHKAFSGEL